MNQEPYFFSIMHSSEVDWMRDADCKGQEEVFYREDPVEAQRICVKCPVQVACLAFAIAHHIVDGVWGGASEEQLLFHARKKISGRMARPGLESFEPDGTTFIRYHVEVKVKEVNN